MASQQRLYFAYGSNLSLAQMASRCPTSTYHSFGRLRNYKWIIGERGYANIISAPPSSHSPASQEHVVYGLLYTLLPADERLLDLAEGVPDSYTKHNLEIETLAPEKGKVQALVYVDERRLGEGVCVDEYVRRMNRGIGDAVVKGMEKWYIERYIRPFVPDTGMDDGKEIEDPFHPRGGSGES